MKEGFSLNYPGRYGMLGCIVFFLMITGYFVTAQVDRKAYSPLFFIQKRFLGIYPMYWIVAGILMYLNLSFFHSFQTTKGFWKSFLLIAGPHNTICRDEWTLYFQMLFYVAAALFFDSRLKKIYPVLLVLGFMFIAIYNSVFGLSVSAISYKLIIKSWPFGSLLLGGICYYLKKMIAYTKQIKLYWGVAYLIFFIFLYDVVLNCKECVVVFIYYLLSGMAFWCFIHAKKIRHDRVLMIISDLSFQIYLLHPTVYLILFTCISNYGLRWNIVLHVGVVLATFIISVIVAYCLKILHNPFHEWALKKIDSLAYNISRNNR